MVPILLLLRFMFAVFVSVAAVASLLGVIVHGLRHAPEGYQDETGFHVVPSKKPTGAILNRRSQETTADTAIDLRLRPAVGPAKG